MTSRQQTSGANPSTGAHAEQIRARVSEHRPIGFVHPGVLPEDRERAALWFSLAAMGAPFVFVIIGCVIAAKFFG
jgi:hypothetical protein